MVVLEVAGIVVLAVAVDTAVEAEQVVVFVEEDIAVENTVGLVVLAAPLVAEGTVAVAVAFEALLRWQCWRYSYFR